MKSILKLTTGVFAAALLSIGFVSCSEDTMDDINKDLNHATDAPAKYTLAEALVRLGRVAEAEPVLKEAIELSFANLEASVYAACTAPTVGAYGGIEDIIGNGEDLTDADADAYFDAEVKPRLAANPLKETLIQKYLSMWGANGESLETFNDVRRLISLGEEGLLELANTKRFPLRYTYGSSDTTTNPNVNSAYGDGQYVYSEPVWWAGGSR